MQAARNTVKEDERPQELRRRTPPVGVFCVRVRDGVSLGWGAMQEKTATGVFETLQWAAIRCAFGREDRFISHVSTSLARLWASSPRRGFKKVQDLLNARRLGRGLSRDSIA